MGTRFVKRDGQNKICGDFSCIQIGYAEEEIDESHPDFVAYKNPLPPTQEELEAACIAALNGGGTKIDLRKVIIAKAVSDEAYRLGKAPGALTGPELVALRQRIANIYKTL